MTTSGTETTNFGSGFSASVSNTTKTVDTTLTVPTERTTQTTETVDSTRTTLTTKTTSTTKPDETITAGGATQLDTPENNQANTSLSISGVTEKRDIGPGDPVRLPNFTATTKRMTTSGSTSAGTSGYTTSLTSGLTTNDLDTTDSGATSDASGNMGNKGGGGGGGGGNKGGGGGGGGKGGGQNTPKKKVGTTGRKVPISGNPAVQRRILGGGDPVGTSILSGSTGGINNTILLGGLGLILLVVILKK